jgi:hypothetical protein
MMETTLNVHVEILETIALAAASAGISRSKMITMLIKMTMDDIPDPARIGSMVRYQKRRKPDEWRQIHLQLRIDDYEYFQDLRKLRKMSISYILAYAIENFLARLLDNRNTDNYRYQNYIVIQETIENITSWRFIWGYPPNIEKYIQFT